MHVSRKTIALLVTFVITIMLCSVFAFRSVTSKLGLKPTNHAVNLEVHTSSADSHLNGMVHSAMSNAFDDGVLPQPATPSASDPDAVIAELAKQIAARDDGSTPALITALQEAGFSIRAKTGEIELGPTDKSQGLAFEAWEVAAMAKLYGQRCSISLSDLSASLATGMPELGAVLVPDVIAQSIANSADGPQPLRSWSRLIIEMGRRSSIPYDLSAKDVDLSKVQLDPIQQALIMRRIVGDLIAAKKPGPNIKKTAMRSGRFRFNRAQLQETAYHPQSHARLLRTDEPSGNPCELDENGAIIVDWNAIAWTTEWKNIIKIEEQLEGPGLSARVNAALILVRFYLIYAGLHSDIRIDKTPLVRTQDTSPGKTANLIAHVTWKLDNWDLACFLAILRAFMGAGYGLDIGNFPNQGDVNGVGVGWILTECGIDRNIKAVDQQTADLQKVDEIIAFEPDSGFDGLHNIEKEVTKDGGKAIMPIYGLPQSRDLSQDYPKPVMKPCAVAIEVKFKGANPEQFLSELSDIVGPALGLTSGDVLGGLVGGLTEMLYRMSWRIGDEYEFWVQDWSAKPVWVGTVTYVETYRDDKPPHTSQDKNLSSEVRTEQTWDDRDATLTMVLTPAVDSLGVQILKGTVSRKNVLKRHSEGHGGACNWTTDNVRTENMPGHSIDGFVSVEVDSLGTYSVHPLINNRDLKWTVEQSVHYTSSCPSKDKDLDYTDSYTGKLEDLWDSNGFSVVNAIPDKQHPDRLQGSTSVTSLGLGQTGTITWDLRMQ